MKLTVLTENTAGGSFLAEHGLSYLIEHDGKTILFDTGHSDVFLKNAKQLGLNIDNKVDTVVLSHGHWDHGDGLRYIKDKTLITHPDSFMKRFRKGGKSNIGLALSYDDLNKKFNLITTKEPYYISDSFIFLGEIPRLNNFESQTTTFAVSNGNDDFIPDDSAIALIDKNEIIVVTGCSHSGICNIIEHAKKVTGLTKVKAVIGGFHLKHNNKQTQQTINYIKNNNIENVYPSHCTDLPALSIFYSTFKIEQLKTGMRIDL